MHCLRRLLHEPRSIVPIPNSLISACTLGCDRSTWLRRACSSFELSKGEQVLKYWQALLGDSDGAESKADRDHVRTDRKTDDIRDLLHTAIRVRQGRVSGVLPEQLMSTFVQVYHKAMNAEDRLRLFQLLCKDFGVQGKSAMLLLPVRFSARNGRSEMWESHSMPCDRQQEPAHMSSRLI